METSVDTLVYQLEEDDTNVRWATLQKLRRIAAVETSHFPVRNTRRFLQCVRRRIVGEADPHVAVEALRLVSDVMLSLGDNVDQILSAILPHLIPNLPKTDKTQDSDCELYDEMVHVFRKYATVSNDLQAVADLLVNVGLGSAKASVREVSLVVLMLMLDDRFQKRTIREDSANSAIGRYDKALIVALVQAIIPSLEDSSEKVVVSAEEAIAKLESYWGKQFSSDVMQFLSIEDKRTLHEHREPIADFLLACTAAASSQPSLPSSSTSTGALSDDSCSSPPSSLKVHPLAMPTKLCFGFLNAEVVVALTTHTSNSNADWKKRASAVEKLYAACKEVDAEVLRGLTANEKEQRLDELEALFDILVRLTQDVDAHLVKRALQITQILFRKLNPPRVLENDVSSGNDDGGNAIDASEDAQKGAAFYMTKMLAPMVETSSNFAEDDKEMECFVYALLGQVFESRCVKVNAVEQVLSATSFRHRRSQVRGEALKVWVFLLLVTFRGGCLPSKYVPNVDAVHALGRLLGDTAAHVRDLAFEVAAVLTNVCRFNIYALLETVLDDEYVSQRVDWFALRARLRRQHVPELHSNGTLRLKNSGSDHQSHRVASSVEQSLDGVSELRMMVTIDKARSFGKEDHIPKLDENLKQGVVGSLSDRSYFNQLNGDAESVTSCRTTASDDVAEVDIGGKLSALKKKMDQLRREPSMKRGRRSDRQERNGGRTAEYRKAEVVSSNDKYQMPRSQSSPKRITRDDEVDSQPQKNTKFSERLRDKRVHPTLNVEAPSASLKTSSQHSPQHLQSLQSAAVNREDRPLKSKFIELQNELQNASEDLSSMLRSPDDRPIRPMPTSGNADQIYLNFTEQENSVDNNGGHPPKRSNNGERAMSLATRKRLEAKAKQDAAGSTTEAPEQNISRLQRENAEATKPWKKQVKVSAAEENENKTRQFGAGKQEPRYLDPHEVTPLAQPKQSITKVLTQLRSDDWEANFEGLNIVRRLATHHVDVVDPIKLHAIMTEILKQIPNLRSSVSKNALLALESICGAFARSMDTEIDNIIPVLLRRCADSNTFVCESAALSLHAVVLKCSTTRVVSALSTHISSKAVPIRREVARGVHALLLAQAESNLTGKDLSVIVQLVGRCLDDSSNEVRDVAKQSIAHLHISLHMSADRLKRYLPASIHAKVDSLLSGKSPLVSDTISPSPIDNKRDVKLKKVKKTSSTRSSPPSSGNGTRQANNNEDIDRLAVKLDSNNWKDRFDALNEVGDFICGCASSLVQSSRMLDLFDSLIKRLDDGNAKVNVLALETMEKIIPAVGSGMEQVLTNLVPVIVKNLSSNARMSSLAQSTIQSLCAHVDGRSLCQQFVIQARSANSRAIPVLLDTLSQLTAQSADDKNQYVLTRQVLPLALDLLKEAKSGVKEANAKLLRQLQSTLGDSTVMAAASKLSKMQQEKLTSILR